jgi:CBS domain-containing protein
MKVKDVLPQIGNLPYLTIHVDCTLEEASKKITDAGHLRNIYVVNHQGQLQGVLSLGELIRSLITSGHKPHFHARSLLVRITAEIVADIMDKYMVCAKKEEDLNSVLERMIDNHIKEIPVIDDKKKIIANIGIIDLWKLIENRRKV